MYPAHLLDWSNVHFENERNMLLLESYKNEPYAEKWKSYLMIGD